MKQNKNAFTLIELLAVIVVLAIIIVVTIPSVISSMNSAKTSQLSNANGTVTEWFTKQYELATLGAGVGGGPSAEYTTFGGRTGLTSTAKNLDAATVGGIPVPITKRNGENGKEKYDGKFPIWLIIEFFSMGMLSYFYEDLQSGDQKYIAKEIYARIAEEDGFRKQIKRYLKHDVVFDEKKNITCSIGIACEHNVTTEAQVNELIKKADDLMYTVKNAEKGHYAFL